MEGDRPTAAIGQVGGPFNPQAAKRKLTSWLDAFLDYTEAFPSPPLFKKWTGISILAGALERKVWAQTRIGSLYPTSYIALVGPPGGGKTVLTSTAKELWMELEGHHIASDSVSPQSLVDDLREADRRILMPEQNPPLVSFNSLKIAIDEMGLLIPQYDNSMISLLTAMYDGKRFAERKRQKDLKYAIERPQLTLLAGCTASYLRNLLPEGAWDQGFTSRFIFVYNGETFPQELFGDDAAALVDNTRRSELVNDLRLIASMYGKMHYQSEVVRAISAWHMGGGKPRPDHPKLQFYNTRRSVHLLKLCIVASVNRGGDMQVTLDDYNLAFDWLTEVETYMPDIFKAMSMGGDSRLIEETWHFAYSAYTRDKKPLTQQRLLGFLAERAPAHSVVRILEVMVGAGILNEQVEPKIGKVYTPRGRKA